MRICVILLEKNIGECIDEKWQSLRVYIVSLYWKLPCCFGIQKFNSSTFNLYTFFLILWSREHLKSIQDDPFTDPLHKLWSFELDLIFIFQHIDWQSNIAACIYNILTTQINFKNHLFNTSFILRIPHLRTGEEQDYFRKNNELKRPHYIHKILS